jgi:hypothetical protein
MTSGVIRRQLRKSFHKTSSKIVLKGGLGAGIDAELPKKSTLKVTTVISFSHFVALVHMHSVLLDVCSTNIHFLFYLPSSTHVRGLSLFLLHTSLLSPAELSWSKVFKHLCKLDSSCPVIEISSF